MEVKQLSKKELKRLEMEELEKALEEMGMANEAAAAEQEAAPAPEPEAAAGNSCSGSAGSLLLFLYSSAPFLSPLVPALAQLTT